MTENLLMRFIVGGLAFTFIAAVLFVFGLAASVVQRRFPDLTNRLIPSRHLRPVLRALRKKDLDAAREHVGALEERTAQATGNQKRTLDSELGTARRRFTAVSGGRSFS
ncbi:MAG TPA: hypothetical protein VM223_08425 [Planctomycetota bacterium]|nr:hypothetical protein [Planctomycetota bacterium]